MHISVFICTYMYICIYQYVCIYIYIRIQGIIPVFDEGKFEAEIHSNMSIGDILRSMKERSKNNPKMKKPKRGPVTIRYFYLFMNIYIHVRYIYIHIYIYIGVYSYILIIS
jgi:hypothetical protein